MMSRYFYMGLLAVAACVSQAYAGRDHYEEPREEQRRPVHLKQDVIDDESEMVMDKKSGGESKAGAVSGGADEKKISPDSIMIIVFTMATCPPCNDTKRAWKDIDVEKATEGLLRAGGFVTKDYTTAEAKALARKHGVELRSFPIAILLVDDKKVATRVGYLPPAEAVLWIRQILGSRLKAQQRATMPG